MDEDIKGTPPIATQADTDGKNQGLAFWIKLAVLALLLAGGYAGGQHFGWFAPSIGTSLDSTVAAQIAPIAGDSAYVTCPPSAKFYAGAMIVCEVAGVTANTSLMPNMEFVNVYVMTHDQFRVLPVSVNE
jgi:hypothetical protein